jgi:hypothetical protein
VSEISDSIDETISALEALHAGDRQRKAAAFAGLQRVVASLDAIPPQIEDEYEAAELHPRRREDPRQAPPETGDGFGEVPIPHGRPGHELGPAVRAQLLRDALDQGNW